MNHINIHTELDRVMSQTITIAIITEKLYPELKKYVINLIKSWNVNLWTVDRISKIDNELKNKSNSEIIELINEIFYGLPYGDIREEREIQWTTLGTVWKIVWKNEYRTIAIAEKFISILQIFQAELAYGVIYDSDDFYLLKTSVEVEFSTIDEGDSELQVLSPGKWSVKLSINTQDIEHEFFHIVAHLLMSISLLPAEQYISIVQKYLKNGFKNKIFVGIPYEDIFQKIINKKDFDFIRTNIQLKLLPAIMIKQKESKELIWFDHLIEHFLAPPEILVSNIYSLCNVSFKPTVEHLMKDHQFILLIKQLRDEGWRDWHILYTLFNFCLNYQTRKLYGIEQDNETYLKGFNKVFSELKADEIINIPINELSEKNMAIVQLGSVVTTIIWLGFELKASICDMKALSQFLHVRCNYWNWDVDHQDPFKY